MHLYQWHSNHQKTSLDAAYHHLKLAVTEGSIEARIKLGELYYDEGVKYYDVEKNKKEAMKYFAMSVDHGNEQARERLALER